MRIEDIALAEQIEITPERALQVTRPIYTIRAPSLPFTKPDFMIGFVVVVTEAERALRFDAAIEMVAPDGNVLFGMGAPNIIAMIETPDPLALRGAIVAGCEVDFEQAGVYEVRILLNGKKEISVNFEVVQEP